MKMKRCLRCGQVAAKCTCRVSLFKQPVPGPVAPAVTGSYRIWNAEQPNRAPSNREPEQVCPVHPYSNLPCSFCEDR